MLIALERRRRHQRRIRPVGARVPLVGDEQVLLAETALRTVADPAAATDLDRALRHLRLAVGDAVPAIYAARVTTEAVLLRLAHPSPAAPTPWTASGDGGTWSLRRADVAALTIGGDAASPYPALVTVATDGTDHVLADLSAPRGVVAVTGAHEAALELLAAMAIEHLLDPWAGTADVVTVGLGDVLAGFGRRVHSAGHLAEVLGTLERAYAGPTPVGALSGPSMLAAQGPRAHLLVATQPTPEEAERLTALAAGGTVTVVVAADVPGAVWTLALDDAGGLTLGALGLSGRAPRLPAASLDAVLRLLQEADRPVPAGPAQGGRARFATVDLGSGLAYDDPALADDLAAWRADVRPRLVLLGQVELVAAGMVPIDRRVALALAARLALHSAGDTVAGLATALGLSEAQTRTGLDQLAGWLGAGHLTVLDERARLRGVIVDALLAERLARRATSHAGARDRMAALADLDALLGLVRDVPLSGLPPVGLRWSGPNGLREDLDALIGDAAHALASAHLADEDPARAAAAARAGLRGAPDSELLWADVLTAERAGGDAGGVTEALRALRAEGGPFTERSQAVLRVLA